MVKFYVVHVDSNYNAILGRITLLALRAITSIPHLKIKFLTEFGVEEVLGGQDMSGKFHLQPLQATSLRVSKQKQTMRIEMEPFIKVGTKQLATPTKEKKEVELYPSNQKKIIQIGLGYKQDFEVA